MRRLVGAVVALLVVLGPVATAPPADARAHAAARCGVDPLPTVAAVRSCWGSMISKGCNWPAARMVVIVWRESRGKPTAWNPTPVRVRVRRRVVAVLHAGGLYEVLGQDPHAPPGVQTARACALFHRQGMRAWAL